MATPSDLDALLVDRGRLKVVTDIDSSLPGSCLALGFEEGTTVLRVTPSDEVEISDAQQMPRNDDPSLAASIALLQSGTTEGLTDLTSHEPWSTVVDIHVAWAWNLTNNSGFNDGLQLEFAEPSSRRDTIVQLMAEGGRFSVRVIPV